MVLGDHVLLAVRILKETQMPQLLCPNVHIAGTTVLHIADECIDKLAQELNDASSSIIFLRAL